MNIDDWRRKIDAIDTALLQLLNLRAGLALEVGKLKNQGGVALRSPRREKAILSRMKSLNRGPLDDQAVEEIYQEILDQSRRAQKLRNGGKSERRRRTGDARQAASAREGQWKRSR